MYQETKMSRHQNVYEHEYLGQKKNTVTMLFKQISFRFVAKFFNLR